MKRFFTFFVALFAMTFFANAQAYLLQEGFEGLSGNALPTGWTSIDADGDGNDWYSLDGANNPDGNYNVHSGTGHVTSASWQSAALTPDNWLITPAINLTSDATLSFWVAGQDASWAAEYYTVYISTTGNSASDFTTVLTQGTATATMTQQTCNLAAYTGQTVYIAFRHHNITDMFRINLDDIEVFTSPTEPTLNVASTSLQFGNIVLGNNSDKTVAVTGFNLTGGITATTSAPFSVSADGNTFGTSATLANEGGTLYVRYAPTEAGDAEGTVTVASGSIEKEIAVSGAAIDCGQITIPYSCSFDDESLNNCWTVVDANNDNTSFIISPASGYASYSYSSTNAADDYLVSPVFEFDGAQLLKFDYMCASSNYPEMFQVLAFGENDTIELTDVITVLNTSAETEYVFLTELEGSYRIAFHCISDADMFRLTIDNFEIMAAGASIEVDPEEIDFSIIPMNSTSDPVAVTITSISVTDAITVATAAPFEVSVDGTDFAATATIPANAESIVVNTVYVRFAPTEEGEMTGELTVSVGDLSETVDLSGVSVDCASSPISELPFLQDFNDGIYPPVCWTVNDPDNYTYFTYGEGGEDKAMGFSDVDYLITPEITVESSMLLTFDYINYQGTDAEEPTTFRVGYSSTDNNISSFTWQETMLCETDALESFTGIIPAGTKYIAIDVTEIGYALILGYYESPDYFIIDNFLLTELSEPTLLVSEDIIDFGNTVLGTPSQAKAVTVTGALTTDNITVTAPANFQVSTNGSAYSQSISLPAAGGNFMVRYNATAEGSHSGLVTLTSGTASESILVSGYAKDCSTPKTLPFTQDFESGLSDCEQLLDKDGDGYNWLLISSTGANISPNSGVDALISQSWANQVALNADNWYVLPSLAIPSNGARVSWYVSAQDSLYPQEYYEVKVAVAGTDNYTTLFSETLVDAQWHERHFNLSQFNGQNVNIAFRHYSSDMFVIKIDDITVTPGVGVEDIDNAARIYPNPASSHITVEATSAIDLVEIFNMNGQKIDQVVVDGNYTNINTTNLSNGLYLMKIHTENGVSNKKFSVVK